MKRKSKIEFPAKYMLTIGTVLCLTLILFSFINDSFGSKVKNTVAYVLVPIQNGINTAGTWFSDKADNLANLREIMAENESLKAQVDELTSENIQLQQDTYTLAQLKELYSLDSSYKDYPKVAATVIGKDAGNYFNTFMIDKGSNDGIAVDMNVIAGNSADASGGGLVGIVTEVGENYSKVRSIIDDENNVGAMFLSTADSFIVAGDLKLINEGKIRVELIKNNVTVNDGDKIVTSTTSKKYLPNLLIGYVSGVTMDANNLTQSGYVTPAVDFEHLQYVLVITELKETGQE